MKLAYIAFAGTFCYGVEKFGSSVEYDILVANLTAVDAAPKEYAGASNAISRARHAAGKEFDMSATALGCEGEIPKVTAGCQDPNVQIPSVKIQAPSMTSAFFFTNIKYQVPSVTVTSAFTGIEAQAPSVSTAAAFTDAKAQVLSVTTPSGHVDGKAQVTSVTTAVAVTTSSESTLTLPGYITIASIVVFGITQF